MTMDTPCVAVVLRLCCTNNLPDLLTRPRPPGPLQLGARRGQRSSTELTELTSLQPWQDAVGHTARRDFEISLRLFFIPTFFPPLFFLSLSRTLSLSLSLAVFLLASAAATTCESGRGGEKEKNHTRAYTFTKHTQRKNQRDGQKVGRKDGGAHLSLSRALSHPASAGVLGGGSGISSKGVELQGCTAAR